MGYCDYLVEMLRPLGVYDLTPGSLSHSELQALGAGMDTLSQALAYVEQEASLSTAQGEGLTRREKLFAKAPVNHSPALRREAIAALLMIQEDNFTLGDLNRILVGCGVHAQVEETGRFGYVRVVFPDTVGMPQDFQQIRSIILDILPCHLDVEFYFRFLTWRDCHRQGYTWQQIHQRAMTWHTFMEAVE